MTKDPAVDGEIEAVEAVAAPAAEENVLILANPINIDGRKVTRLSYDFDGLTVKDIVEAERRVREQLTGTSSPQLQEFDRMAHLYTFIQAVVCKNPSYDIRDLERMKGKDVFKAMNLGRSFLLQSGAGEETRSEEL